MSDQTVWVLFFEDADRRPEFFSGEGAEWAAHERFKQASNSWSCHLFVNESRLTAAEKERDEAQAFREEEHTIVQKVWKALGKETYQDCKPYTIWEWVEKDKQRIATLENALRGAKVVMEKTTLACSTFPVEISSEDLKQTLV